MTAGCQRYSSRTGVKMSTARVGWSSVMTLSANAPRDAPDVAGLKCLLLVADDEDRLSLQQHADLVVRVRVLLDDRMRLQVDDGHHHAVGGAGPNVDAGEDRVTGHSSGVGKNRLTGSPLDMGRVSSWKATGYLPWIASPRGTPTQRAMAWQSHPVGWVVSLPAGQRNGK